MASKADTRTPVDVIPLSEPALGGNEWRYVKECLDTNWVSSVGPFVTRFEQMIRERIGVKSAVAVVNGTAALHLALRVAGIEPDDEVVLPSLTFIAPANAVRYLGAWPVFVDVDDKTGQLDPQRFADFLSNDCERANGGLRNRHTGRRVHGVLPVDILGHPADLDPIVDLAHQHGLVVVEDATESLGARYKGAAVGSRADVACLSFNGNKIITTGGGGMLLTNRVEWAERARHLSTQAKSDPVEYAHDEVGYNYRLTNVLAAIGVAQLEQLDERVTARRRVAERYSSALDGRPGVAVPTEAPWAFSTYWLYTVRIDPDAFGMGSRALLQELAAAGIQARPVWEPLHRSAVHQASYACPAPAAEAWHREALSLPSSASLTPEQQRRVIDIIQRR